jgi:hypothetical protein
MMKPFANSLHRALLASLFTIGAAISASAQGGASAPAESPPTLTGKERLGPKWTDEQRLDNCNVPIDKRGTRLRPSTCARLDGVVGNVRR